MIGQVIESDADVTEGAEWLAKHSSRFRFALDTVETVPLRLRPDGFTALLRAIVSQQISVAAAASIWKRVQDESLDCEDAILAASDDELRAVGLSRPKLKYAKALAESGIDYDALKQLPDDQVVDRLVEVKGIGRWTAEIYAMFSLGRADAFAAGDLALQEAARLLFELDERPTEKEFRMMSNDWSPWRSVAARILWEYYRFEKNRDGID